MEQAVNTFQHGLQMDTHPMNHGNDSLTDALNATLATMNGNEAILQNDMGNAKVDNAYLPAGYVPVGIKEHGGIIYVASYNPITNRSQLGSFPSPERKYNNKDLNINQEIKLEDLKDSESVSFCNSSYNCLKTDERIYNLTEKNIIRTGDKFALWFDGNFDDLNKLSNRNNTSNGKVTSPKNKLYTLSVGVINSQNEFVDITKTLGRWNGNKLVKYTNKTDLYKFNDHYFIAGGQPNDATSPAVPKKDRELLKERQVKELNTYTYKLLGPLCIKTKLNHVESFSYNIYGLRTDDNKAELWIEGYVTYNCPDGINSGGGSDDNYINYCDDSQLSNCFFDFKVDGQNKGVLLTGNEYKTKYDPTTNLYTVKQVLHIEPITGNNNKIDYFIGVKPCLDNELNGKYLRDLSNCGTIDISKLGSGTYELKEWRFTSNLTTKTSTLVYTIEAYPKYGEKLDHLELIFDNKDITNKVKCILPLNNGTTMIEFNWRDPQMFSIEPGESGNYNYLLDRALYSVTEIKAICLGADQPYPVQHIYTTTNNNNEEEETKVDAREFFLTTERMNSCFNPRNEDFIRDYGFPRTVSEKEAFKRKRIIQFNINAIVEDQSKYDVIDEDINIISKNSNLYNKYTTQASVNICNKSTVEVKDLERLYPSYIVRANNADNYLSFKDVFLINRNIFKDISITQIGNSELSIQDLLEQQLIDNILNNHNERISIGERGPIFFLSDKTITGSFNYYDIYKSIGKSDESVITNGFVKLTENRFRSWFNEDSDNYGGVYLETEHDDCKRVRVIKSNKYSGFNPDGSNSGEYEVEYKNVATYYGNQAVLFKKNSGQKLFSSTYDNVDREIINVEESIQAAFQSYFSDKNVMFIFVFYDHDKMGSDELWFTNDDPKTIYNMFETLNELSSTNFARVWWRGSNSQWVLISDLLSKEIDINNLVGQKTKANILYNFLKRIGLIRENMVYAMYQNITCRDAGLYIPDFQNQSYNNFYEIILPFKGKIVIENANNCLGLSLGETNKELDKIGQVIEIKNIENFNDTSRIVNLNNSEDFYFTTSDEINYYYKDFYIECKLKSSRKFQDYIDLLKEHINLNNVFLENGLTTDYQNYQLNARNFYVYNDDTKQLIGQNYNNLQITSDYGPDGIQVVIPRINPGTPAVLYDLYSKRGEDEKRRIMLDYSDFNVINSIISVNN